MTIMRRTRADIDLATLEGEYAKQRPATEAEIERWADEDGDAWTDEDFLKADLVHPLGLREPTSARKRVKDPSG